MPGVGYADSMVLRVRELSLEEGESSVVSSATVRMPSSSSVPRLSSHELPGEHAPANRHHRSGERGLHSRGDPRDQRAWDGHAQTQVGTRTSLPKFTDYQRKALVDLALSRPRYLVLPYAQWSPSRLREQAVQRGSSNVN